MKVEVGLDVAVVDTEVVDGVVTVVGMGIVEPGLAVVMGGTGVIEGGDATKGPSLLIVNSGLAFPESPKRTMM